MAASLRLYRRLLRSLRAFPFLTAVDTHCKNLRQVFELRRHETSPDRQLEFVRDGLTVLRAVEALNKLSPEQRQLINFWKYDEKKQRGGGVAD